MKGGYVRPFVHKFPCQSIGGATINHLYRRHLRKINSLTPFFKPFNIAYIIK